jgi:hypothetical protein
MRGIATLLALCIMLAHVSACGPEHPCDNEEKLVTSYMHVEDGEVKLEALSGYGADGFYGTVDDSLVSECLGTTSTLWLEGATPSLRAFRNFRTIGALVLYVVYGLPDLTDLSEVETIGTMQLGADAPTYAGLTSLVEVGAIDIRGGGEVGGIPDWTALERVYGEVRMTGRISTIAGLSGLRQVGHLFLTLTQISDLSVLSSLELVEGAVEIRQNPIEVLGMDALREIGGSLYLNNGVAWTAWNGLASVERIRGDVTVRGNPGIASADVWNWIEGVVVDGSIEICSNLGSTIDDPCPSDTSEDE